MWKTVKLGDVAEVVAGQSPDGSFYNANGIGLAFYQGKKDFGKRYLKAPTVWTTEVTKKAYPGDILISVRAPVGALNYTREEVCIGRGLAAIRVSEKVLSDFIYYHLLSAAGSYEKSAGAIFESINKKQIENINVLLPPLAEQQRIVEKLDRAFEEIDRAIEATTQKERTAVKLRQLVVDRLLGTSADLVSLGSICEFVRGPFGGSLKKNIFVDSGVAIYEQQHAINNQCEKFRYFITEEKFNEMRRFEVRANSLLMSCSGTIGKTTIVSDRAPKGIINQALLMMKPSSKLYVEYLQLFMESSFFKEQLMDTVGGAAIQNVASVKTLKEIKIRLPSISQQKIAVDELLGAFSILQDINQAAGDKLIQLSQLKSAIIAQELKGPES